jgi:iron complex outermembrane receptor protein
MAGGVVISGCRVAILLLASSATMHAHAQRADDNAVTAAEDAFGATLGEESIGLYSSSQVRGFSPVAAGNVRIEGLYFDRRASLPTRLVEGSAVRVGISAQGYPFPAPTGIVDYRLQRADKERVISIAAGLDPYASPSLEVDAKFPVVPGRLGVAAGISYGHEEYYDGSNAHYVRAAVIPRWRPAEHIEVMPFWALTSGRDEEVAPTIVTSGSHAPPQIARRNYFGQSWADAESDSVTHGVMAKGRFGPEWAFAAGVFRSEVRTSQDFADVYVNTTMDGLTRELLIADPAQYQGATSGELRLSRSFTEPERLHVLHASIRGRNQRSRYGGSAPPLDLGWRQLGERTPIPEPAEFEFTERTLDTVRQWTAGLMYEGRWRGVGEATFGVQRTDYEKVVQQPGRSPTGTNAQPWLSVATVAVHLSPTIALYAGHTQGLEESGIAPDSAANRNEALPAIRTRQVDGGLRWVLTPELKVVAGLFEVTKPYFSTDENNLFTSLGEVRHRGVELSVSGKLEEEWTIVAGAVLMQPRVTGEAVDLGRVGDRPVGQSGRLLRANVEYRPKSAPALSLDVGLSHFGERVASSDNRLELPEYTLVDLGARYRLRMGRAPATLRVQVSNITDEFAWSVFANNSFGLMDGRRYSALLFVDF